LPTKSGNLSNYSINYLRIFEVNIIDQKEEEELQLFS
jgi:hypothetical protein